MVSVFTGVVEDVTLVIFAVLHTRSLHYADIRNTVIEKPPVSFLIRTKSLLLFWVIGWETQINFDSTTTQKKGQKGEGVL